MPITILINKPVLLFTMDPFLIFLQLLNFMLYDYRKHVKAIESLDDTRQWHDYTFDHWLRSGLCFYAQGNYRIHIYDTMKSILLGPNYLIAPEGWHSMNDKSKFLQSLHKRIEWLKNACQDHPVKVLINDIEHIDAEFKDTFDQCIVREIYFQNGEIICDCDYAIPVEIFEQILARYKQHLASEYKKNPYLIPKPFIPRKNHGTTRNIR